MNNSEAKEALDNTAGFLCFIRATCVPKEDTNIRKMIDDFIEAKEIAKEAIDIMDNKLDIENKGDK